MSTVILSSPHALCPSSEKRKCDIVAGDAAECLRYELAKYSPDIKCICVQGNEYRHDHDLNRTVSRNTQYRRRLSEIITTSKKSAIIVDVHSFPNYWMKEAGDINFFKKTELAPDIVILEGKHDMCNGISISKTLCNNLRTKYNCKIISGITVNDILNEASEYNIPGVLLEFNEKYKDDVDGLKIMCRYIVYMLSSMITK